MPVTTEPALGAAEVAGFFLVQPGAEPAVAGVQRAGGDKSAQRGRRGPGRRRLLPPPRPDHSQGRRHRQLRTGGAAAGRRGAGHDRDSIAIEWQRPGMLRVGPGRKLIDIDSETRPNGWELRMHPSTKRTATIGGFVARRVGRRRVGHLGRPAGARATSQPLGSLRWRRNRA